VSDIPADVLDAAERGWSLIPCGLDKRPMVKWKPFQTEAATRDQLESWAARKPASWAVVTGAVSGFVAFDFSADDGERLREKYGLPVNARSGSGGPHTYIEHPGFYVATLNGRAKHELGDRFPGLDIKGDGGYAIFCGRNAKGEYKLFDPKPLPFAELPSELSALVSQNGKPSAKQLVAWALRRAAEGNRNSVGFDLACQLRDNGFDRADAEMALLDYQRQVPNGDEPYTVEEARSSVEQAYTRPPREPWSGKPQTFTVEVDDKGEPTLPEIRGDTPGLCAWLTAVFALDPKHPITAAVRQGRPGPDSSVVVKRAGLGGAYDIRFDPITRLNTPSKLIEALSSYMLHTDGAVPALKTAHCRQISYVVRMLCGASERMSAAEEATGIVGTFLQVAVPIEGCTTYGNGAQRYEAAVALRRELDPTTGRPLGPLRYLIDADTGELVIAVSDLGDAARRHIGSSLPRGWLDGRMETLGWQRVVLDGHERLGRSGRESPHATVITYRGYLPMSADDGAENASQ
jgi:Bifunctional DNA primase/polymerase, N-terminal